MYRVSIRKVSRYSRVMKRRVGEIWRIFVRIKRVIYEHKVQLETFKKAVLKRVDVNINVFYLTEVQLKTLIYILICN